MSRSILHRLTPDARWRLTVVTALMSLLVFLALLGEAKANPVTPVRPRVLVTPVDVQKFQARRLANDPAWIALKAKADEYVSQPIQPYNKNTVSSGWNGTLFYTYSGSEWEYAAMTLGLAYLASGDTVYSNKMFALADEMVRAENDPMNTPANGGISPFRYNYAFASRHLGKAIAVIYDWAYPRLSPQRKAAYGALMKQWLSHLRNYEGYGTYQNTGPATGNYYGGHMAAAGFMGLALAGDDPEANRMIAWARARFDGTPSPLLTL
ncbi:MAG TPA: hypothetical protein VD948_02185, partial [Rhodothermales bacterium]|nr:hypothetical protein [Rhodothermales bacterium]